MSTVTERFTVIFPADYDPQSEAETPLRGYLTEVVVQLDSGSRYPLSFFDPVRLQQDLTELVKWGKTCLAEVNLVVLPEVTTDGIRKAVAQLVEEDYFQYLKPL